MDRDIMIFKLVIVWFALQIPMAILVGKFLKGRAAPVSPQQQEGTINMKSILAATVLAILVAGCAQQAPPLDPMSASQCYRINTKTGKCTQLLELNGGGGGPGN